jgi:hypothetical protein
MTGGSWTWDTPLSVAPISAANGGATRHGTLATVGHIVAKVVQPSIYGNIRPGIAYTADYGQTWRSHLFADADAFSGPPIGIASLIGANGRFWATDTERVYRSGLVLA